MTITFKSHKCCSDTDLLSYNTVITFGLLILQSVTEIRAVFSLCLLQLREQLEPCKNDNRPAHNLFDFTFLVTL